jgi:hypothetical protein
LRHRVRRFKYQSALFGVGLRWECRFNTAINSQAKSVTHNYVGTRGVLFGLQCKPIDKDFRKQIPGYGLTTAEIVYRRPDRHWLLQTYVWQDYDMFPHFPALKGRP